MDYDFNRIAPSIYIKLVKNQTVRPRFKLSLLYQNEVFKEDISDYLISGSGTLNISYNQGQRRSLNFSLDNSSGIFTPNGLNNKLWMNTKFKLELGMEFSNGDTVWNSAGIFVIGNPRTVRENAQRTIDIQCYDKFALLDGTLGGVLTSAYQVNPNENIYRIMTETLLQDNGNGYPLDIKPIVFDSLYHNETTQYTLSKSPNESIGSILVELANMISCDIYYGTEGNLVVRSGIRNISQINKPILWAFDDTEYEYLSSETNYDFVANKNRVVVVGANVNGDNIYVGIAENNNPQYPNRISEVGYKEMYLEDSNIFNEALARERAEYELNKITIIKNTILIKSSYMIHLDVDNLILLKDSFFKYDDRFIIQTISIPLSVDSQIDIECTNIADLPYYSSNS